MSALASMKNTCRWHFTDFNSDFSLKSLGLVQNVSNTLHTACYSVHEWIAWPTWRRASCDIMWILSIGLISVLCDGHSKRLTLLSLSHFVTNLAVCLGSLSIWRIYLRPSFNFLPKALRCFLNISTSCSFLMMPSILWSAQLPPAANYPLDLMLPPL